MSLGGKLGLILRGSIIKYHSNGTADVRIDRESTYQSGQTIKNVPLPLAFSGANGELIGGAPEPNAPVIISHGQGEWFISSFIPHINTFTQTSFGKNRTSELRPGRILFQTKEAKSRVLLDPNDGTHIGTINQEVHADPIKGILSSTYRQSMSFTSANRSITGHVRRDLKENSNRNITGSVLSSHEYDSGLSTIGMDPSSPISTTTTSTSVRNLPLVENKEIVYELQNYPLGQGFTTDDDEATRYISKQKPEKPSVVLRTESRTDGFNLSLTNPNHLMETIKGTGVDIYGNILDLNRSILPIGRTKENKLTENTDSQDAFRRIRALHRKSLAFHFELNSRKQTFDDQVAQVPDITSKKDYARDRSKLFIDVDKEGQFKINVPSSSETGNIGLLTRYENASRILAAKGELSDPNAFFKEKNNIDIELEDFGVNSSVKLGRGEGKLEGYEAPIDRFTGKPIKLGTAHHDITKTALQHQKAAGRDSVINYFLSDEIYLNKIEQIDKVVSDTINVAGDDANAGGRSGTINLDGMLSVSIGANTVDRQSLWTDYAGGIVSNVGRDLYGRSFVGTMDGDVLLQIGGPGIGDTADSRFASENNGNRAGTLDIRVVMGDGQLAVIRIDSQGMFVSSPGRLEVSSEQEMTFRSNSNIKFEAPSVIFYPDNNMGRIVKRNGVGEI